MKTSDIINNVQISDTIAKNATGGLYTFYKVKIMLKGSVICSECKYVVVCSINNW